MVMQADIVLMTEDPATAAAVGEAMSTRGGMRHSEVYCTLADLTRRLEQSAPAAVLVDLDPDPVHTLSQLDPVIARFTASRFIVISEARRDDWLMQAMQVGARHFIAKPSLRTELPPVLDRLRSIKATSNGARGQILTVLSAGGGCGSTTVAVNLAHELRQQNGDNVLLVDMDCAYGAVATYLGLDSRFGIADVLAYSGRIDHELVQSTAQTHSEKLAVLLSPATTNALNPSPLNIAELSTATNVCREIYSHTVIDAPRATPDLAATLVALSQRSLLVLQLSVKDIRMARALITAIASRGVPMSQLTIVVNRYGRKSGGFDLTEARQALGDFPLVCLRNDYRSALRGINMGQPLGWAAPRTPLRKDLQQLARSLAQTDGHSVSH
jgi:pilus assembly protein CpaE